MQDWTNASKSALSFDDGCDFPFNMNTNEPSENLRVMAEFVLLYDLF